MTTALLAIVAAMPTQPITLHYHRSEHWTSCCVRGSPGHFDQDVQRDFVIAPADAETVMKLKDEWPINIPLSGGFGGKARLWGPVRMRGLVWLQLEFGGDPVAVATDAETDREKRQAMATCQPSGQLIGQPGVDQMPTNKVMLTYAQVQDLAHFKGRWPPPGHEQSNPADPNCGGTVTIEMSATGPAPGKPVVDGVSCACQGKSVQLHAHLDGAPEGTFLPFRLSGGGTATQNSGGDAPSLTMQGDGKSDGAASVVAVFKKKDGTQLESTPFQLHFASVDAPEIQSGGYGVNGGSPQDFCFSGGDPHVEFDVKGKGWLDARSADAQLRWDISPASYLQKKGDPGGKVTYFADALPQKNTDFGEQQVKASLRAQGCACQSDPVKLRLFYRLTEKNNPDGQSPNWDYYYKQTSARQDAVYQLVDDVPATPGCTQILAPFIEIPTPGGAVAGNYDFCNNVLYVNSHLMEWGCLGRLDWQANVPRYIDCYAVTLRHERQHQKELIGWWGVGMGNYVRAKDWDGDLIPNSVEANGSRASLGCNAHDDHSCAGRPPYLWKKVNDTEFDAYAVGWSWHDGDADKEDWACPGKQCPNPGGD
jgi:hypothetical protein